MALKPGRPGAGLKPDKQPDGSWEANLAGIKNSSDLPDLKHISYTENAKPGWVTDKTAEEFWKDYDERKKQGSTGISHGLATTGLFHQFDDRAVCLPEVSPEEATRFPINLAHPPGLIQSINIVKSKRNLTRLTDAIAATIKSVGKLLPEAL